MKKIIIYILSLSLINVNLFSQNIIEGQWITISDNKKIFEFNSNMEMRLKPFKKIQDNDREKKFTYKVEGRKVILLHLDEPFDTLFIQEIKEEELILKHRNEAYNLTRNVKLIDEKKIYQFFEDNSFSIVYRSSKVENTTNLILTNPPSFFDRNEIDNCYFNYSKEIEIITDDYGTILLLSLVNADRFYNHPILVRNVDKDKLYGQSLSTGEYINLQKLEGEIKEIENKESLLKGSWILCDDKSCIEEQKEPKNIVIHVGFSGLEFKEDGTMLSRMKSERTNGKWESKNCYGKDLIRLNFQYEDGYEGNSYLEIVELTKSYLVLKSLYCLGIQDDLEESFIYLKKI